MSTNMLAQTTIQDAPRPAFPGLIADMSPVRIKSGVSAAHKTTSIAIVATASTLYRVTINGTMFDYTSGGGGPSATTAGIAAGLVAAINAGSEPVHATGSDTPIIVTSTLGGAAGNYTLTVTGPLTPTVTVPGGEDLPYGRFVCMDVNNAYDRAVKLPSTAADITSARGIGVVCTDNYTSVSDDAPIEAAPGFAMANILEVGRIWVQVDVAVTKGDDAYVRFDATGLGPGSFTKSGGGAALARACFDSSSRTVDGKLLAIVKLNR